MTLQIISQDLTTKFYWLVITPYETFFIKTYIFVTLVRIMAGTTTIFEQLFVEGDVCYAILNCTIKLYMQVDILFVN